MAVARMAVEAGFADGSRTEALERGRIESKVPFEEHLSVVESLYEPLLVYSRSLIFVATLRNVISGSELAARIPLFCQEIADSLSDIFRVGLNFLWSRGRIADVT
jgi:hypothetical protein